MAQAIVPTPLGMLLIDGDGDYVRSTRLLAPGITPPALDGPAGPPAREAAAQITAFFERRLRRFDLPLEPLTSPRGEALRTAIASIPYGEQMSYGALARTIASGPRAVGQACRRNPFPIVIPCHRVVGSGGAIGHYSAGAGSTAKLWLLDHEREDLFRGKDY